MIKTSLFTLFPQYIPKTECVCLQPLLLITNQVFPVQQHHNIVYTLNALTVSPKEPVVCTNTIDSVRYTNTYVHTWPSHDVPSGGTVHIFF